MRHHPVFDPFEPLRTEREEDWDVNFLGVRTRRMFWTGGDPAHPDAGNLPRPDEEYFEWIDVLEAVSNARERFTMVELGAGWGRWLVNAVAAIRRRSDDMAYCLVGVEAEPTHFRWLRQHMLDNDIEFDSAELVNAAVAREDGVVWFHMGEPEAWYGQAIASPNEIPAFAEPVVAGTTVPIGRTIRPVRSLSLATVLAHHRLVDLVDLDVQGVEADVLEGGHLELDARVRRVHVSTHSDENETRLRSLFRTLAWINVHDYSSGHEYTTPHGRSPSAMVCRLG